MFGSAARGEVDTDSDIDLFFVKPASVFHSIVKEGIDIAGGPSWLRKDLRKTEVTA